MRTPSQSAMNNGSPGNDKGRRRAASLADIRIAWLSIAFISSPRNSDQCGARFRKTKPTFPFIECSRNFLRAFCKTRTVDDRSESRATFCRADALDPEKRAQIHAKSWRQPRLLA